MIKLSAVLSFFIMQFLFAAETRPNIVFLLTDDQAAWAVGYNNPEFLTPEIDTLAEQGIKFQRHYNTTAICMASRANIMTGKYEYKTGTNFMHGSMSKALFADSYPVLLRNAGYFTGFVGKFGFDTPPNSKANLPKGYKNLPVDLFDVWYGGEGQTNFKTAKNHYMKKFAAKHPHLTLANGAAAIDFIEQAKESKKPFMLSVSFKAPHAPVVPDPQFDALFEKRQYSHPENYWQEKGQHLALQSKLGRQYLTKGAFGFAPKTYNQRMAKYNQQIYGVDVVVGQIKGKLAELGLSENTVIIFTSDNGYFNGNHGFSRKVLPYEESVTTPMIIFDPRYKKSRIDSITQLTANVDIAPTILTLAGITQPKEMDGKDLMALATTNNKENHAYLPLINVWGSAPAQALSIVTKKWKYIYWFYGDGMTPKEELFDLSHDKGEMKNLANSPEYKPVLDKMRVNYDQQVALWGEHSLKSNGYSQYVTLFDRNISWADKAKLLDNSFIKSYKKEIAPYYKNKANFIETFGLEPVKAND